MGLNRTRKLRTKGGARYTAAKATKTPSGALDYAYGKEHLHMEDLEKIKFNSSYNAPYIFIDTLTNVSIHPNKDINKYKYHGMLIMYIKNASDISTLKWTLDQYLKDTVLKDMNSKYEIKYETSHIKINDFKIINTAQAEKPQSSILDGLIMVTGSIYIPYVDQFDKTLNKTIKKLPSEMERSISEYMTKNKNYY